MNRAPALACLLTLATSCGASPPAESLPVAPTLPALHVSGNRIVDASGAEVRLRGVNLEDPYVLDHFDWDGDFTLETHEPHFAEVDTDFARIASWGANVELPIGYPAARE